ncbi:WD40 repeat domain-containing protein [Aquabacter spiritensis]|uniref:WD-40 repeat-containing protein n=1 Tax=Aquabacter spiritensis TaxID=933073 RepID=A0A4R3M3D4_9HYPH|nr:WD40 repeat domain-containing protein [Aquabacter spiritensis]TCT06739.1 WD-40 repeat-containing protein [Aquabacter spiritensis]
MSSAPSSLTDRVQTFSFDDGLAAVRFIGAACAFIEEAGTATIAGNGGGRFALHDGVVLETAGDGRRLLTCGDDGTVRQLDADGTVTIRASQKGRWVDHVALGPDDSFAYSVGKTAYMVPAKGEPKSLDLPSTVGGLAFAPKGMRLGIAHYGGATLWFPNAQGVKPETLVWKGSHLGIVFSPDSRFVITTMQEPALHGWRLVDAKHMRMTGYPARVKSFTFTSDGKWLASSGSGEVILWPFATKEGPMGKQPGMLAPSSTGRVTQVACHPKDPVVAVGYEDGMVLMARISDGAEILLRAPDGAAVSCAAWRADGGAVAFGTVKGGAGLLEF